MAPEGYAEWCFNTIFNNVSQHDTDTSCYYYRESGQKCGKSLFGDVLCCCSFPCIFSLNQQECFCCSHNLIDNQNNDFRDNCWKRLIVQLQCCGCGLTTHNPTYMCKCNASPDYNSNSWYWCEPNCCTQGDCYELVFIPRNIILGLFHSIFSCSNLAYQYITNATCCIRTCCLMTFLPMLLLDFIIFVLNIIFGIIGVIIIILVVIILIVIILIIIILILVGVIILAILCFPCYIYFLINK